MSHKTILVVDDDKSFVEMMDAALTQRGYRVVKAYDGEQALEKTEASTPDLILLDIKMPKMDGDEVYMALRAEEKTRRIPIITVTALRTEEELLENPEENTFAKPVLIDKLVIRIKQLIGDG